MQPIQTFQEWSFFVNQMNNDMRGTVNSIDDYYRKIDEGTPKATLSQQNAQNRKSVRSLEGFHLILFSHQNRYK